MTQSSCRGYRISLWIPVTATGQVKRLWALMRSDPEKQQGCEATARWAPPKTGVSNDLQNKATMRQKNLRKAWTPPDWILKAWHLKGAAVMPTGWKAEPATRMVFGCITGRRCRTSGLRPESNDQELHCEQPQSPPQYESYGLRKSLGCGQDPT